jgi:RHS repeat-associated protein
MLQSSYFDPVLGLDIHIVLVPTPAGPVPTPVPQPFVGMVFDPVGLALGAAMGMALGGGPGLVLVNNLPVTNAGTAVTNLLTLPHLPVPGVAFAKGKPGNDAELFFGSLNVSLGGSLGVRLGDIAMSCSDPVRLPTSLVLAIPKGPPVLNNPAMVPDLEGIAQKLLMAAGMKALKAAARGGARLFRTLRAAQRKSRGWSRVSGALRSVVDRIAPQRYRDRLKRAVCFVTGHPVDVATGRLFTDHVDFELPGPLPLVFERVYSSSLSWRNGPLGYGWSHSLDQSVWVERGKVVYLAEDGREVEFHTDGLPGRVLCTGQLLYEPTNRLTLRALGGSRWEIEEQGGVVHEFAPVSGGSPTRAKLIRVRSRDGHHSIQLAYDALGRLEWGRDSAGRLLGFVHDEMGRLIEVKLPLSKEAGFYRHIKYGYGERGDLVQVVDAAGHSWKFDYQAHLLVQETDRTGLSFYFQYDGLGASARCVRTWGDGGIYDHVISYDVQNRKTVVEDSLGAVTMYQMDKLGMVVKVVDPYGAVTKYAYDEECGELAEEVDALGHIRAHMYDAKGNVVAVHSPDGATIRIEYGDHGLPILATDALGGTWSWAYDVKGHLIERISPVGERVRWGWKEGLFAWEEAPGGGRTFLEYDSQKNLARVRAPNGALTEYGSDGHGRVVRIKDARGSILRFRYDVLGNLLRVESPSGVVQQYSYDPEGNEVEVQDATRQVRFRYGHLHKRISREEAGTSVRFIYDTEDRLTGVINEAGEVYTFILDACGRPREELGFDGHTRRYERDLLGRVVRMYLPSGRSTELEYDASGRVLKVNHSNGAIEEFTYRVDGALVRAKNECTVVEFERDALGRVMQEVQGEYSVSSRLDASGNRVLVQSSLGGRMAVLRDALGEVASLHFNLSALPAVQFERDPLGLETARMLSGGVRVEWGRDAGGRPSRRRTLRAAAEAPMQPLDSRSYQWRGEDQIAAIVDTARGTTQYQHDARGRLVAQVTPQGTLHRAVDVIGKAFQTSEQMDRRYLCGGRLEQADGVRYSYDEDGNLVEKVGKEGSWRYLWGHSGLLREVRRPDGRRVRFEYDAFARRTRKSVVRQSDHGGEVVESETRFIWDQQTVLHEVSSQTGMTTWYWEPNSLTPVAKEQAGRRWSVVSDHLGTPTEIYDELGQLAWRMLLDLQGVATVDVMETSCPWRWPGQYHDDECGLYYNRFRYYEPQAGQYLSPDPIGLASSLAVYAYPADPLVSTDPLGLAVCPGSRHDEIAHGGWFGRKAWRSRLQGSKWSPHGSPRGKHMRATTAEDAARISSGGGPGQYLPGVNNRALEREALQNGTIIRGVPEDPGSTVHVLYRSDSVVGYANGEPTHWIRAEITAGNIFHGHPRPLSEVRRFIPGAN